MALINRQTLKNYFKMGGVPSEKHFTDLIDSTLNVIDDGIAVTPEHGFKISPMGYSSKLISFFKKTTQNQPEFSVEFNGSDQNAISIKNTNDQTLFNVGQNGFIGVNTDDPKLNLQVSGSFGAEIQHGVYALGEVEGDGNWQTMIDDLSGLNGFEIVAYIRGKKGSGRYALSHAIALSTFGGRFSRSKIKVTSSYYGSYFNKLAFRWVGDLDNYRLEVRTRRHYGIDPIISAPYRIKFHITRFFTD